MPYPQAAKQGWLQQWTSPGLEGKLAVESNSTTRDTTP